MLFRSQTLQAIGADFVVIRHWASGAAHRLATSNWIAAKVINAGDGTHEHPTQALLDAFTIENNFGDDFTKLEVGIVGDILHSRVARSNILLLKKLGAAVTVISPRTLLPIGIENWGVKICHNLDEIIGELDVVMELRIQQERMDSAFFPTTSEFSKRYGLNAQRRSEEHTSELQSH